MPSVELASPAQPPAVAPVGRSSLRGVACVLGSAWFASRLPRLRELVRPIYLRRGIIGAPTVEAGAEGH